MNDENEFEQWLESLALEAIQEIDSRQKWICGRCGWTTNLGQQATLHMWACGQISLSRN